jgi:hypothetical protein
MENYIKELEWEKNRWIKMKLIMRQMEKGVCEVQTRGKIKKME